MNLRKLFTKIISFSLILFGLYQIILSLNTIFFIYLQLNLKPTNYSLIIKKSLIEKALMLYASMIFNGIYGISLLFKPSQEVEIIHIIIGILLMVISLFFITQTPLTTDPILNLIQNLLK